MSKKIILDQLKRHSESSLWTYERDFYDKKGVEAWAGTVPFYITTNPFIANVYADLVLSFVRDWIKKHPDSIHHPFYVLELGAGHGRFGFYVLKRLKELRERLGLHDVHIQYLMSDLSINNIRFWEQHPALSPYFDEGMLDVIEYDLENDTPLYLCHQQKLLSAEKLTNPIVVFANYIFDSISQDMFYVEDNQMHEVLVTLSVDDSEIRKGIPNNLQDIDIQYQSKEIGDEYYLEPGFNHVLQEYKSSLKKSSFMFPVSALRAINYLLEQSHHQLLMISTDKGYTSIDEQDFLSHQNPSFHGSFSMNVNFDAIGRYFKYFAGDYIYQEKHPGIKTVIYGMGFQFKDMKELGLAIYQHVQCFGPENYFDLYMLCAKNFETFPLEALASIMALSSWDPHLFHIVKKRLFDLIDQAPISLKEYFAGHMQNIRDNFYALPSDVDLIFEIGFLLYKIGKYSEALGYFIESQRLYGGNYSNVYNQALCEYALNLYPDSVKHLKKALKYNPDSEPAKKLLDELKDKI